jgi:hypothetical protein
MHYATKKKVRMFQHALNPKFIVPCPLVEDSLFVISLIQIKPFALPWVE